MTALDMKILLYAGIYFLIGICVFIFHIIHGDFKRYVLGLTPTDISHDESPLDFVFSDVVLWFFNILFFIFFTFIPYLNDLIYFYFNNKTNRNWWYKTLR